MTTTRRQLAIANTPRTGQISSLFINGPLVTPQSWHVSSCWQKSIVQLSERVISLLGSGDFSGFGLYQPERAIPKARLSSPYFLGSAKLQLASAAS